MNYANSELDAIDRKILRALQSNSKISIGELADDVGLSPSPCARRVRLLEKAGIVKGYAAVVDQRKVGLPISAFASIKLERQREENLDRFVEAVSRWPEVLDCYLMTGQRDYLMRIVAADLDAYERYIKDKLTRLENLHRLRPASHWDRSNGPKRCRSNSPLCRYKGTSRSR